MGFKSLAEAFAQTPTLTIFVVIAWTAFGLLIGSFLNVVIYRVPRSMSIALPPSHCPTCNTQLSALDNVPLLSWLVLRGRCRTCHVAISARYPAVELGTAVGFGLVAWAVGIRPAALALSLCWALGIVVSGIDLDGLAAGFVLLVLLWIGPVALVVISLVDANASRALAVVFSALAGGCIALLGEWLRSSESAGELPKGPTIARMSCVAAVTGAAAYLLPYAAALSIGWLILVLLTLRAPRQPAVDDRSIGDIVLRVRTSIPLWVLAAGSFAALAVGCAIYRI